MVVTYFNFTQILFLPPTTHRYMILGQSAPKPDLNQSSIQCYATVTRPTFNALTLSVLGYPAL